METISKIESKYELVYDRNQGPISVSEPKYFFRNRNFWFFKQNLQTTQTSRHNLKAISSGYGWVIMAKYFL